MLSHRPLYIHVYYDGMCLDNNCYWEGLLMQHVFHILISNRNLVFPRKHLLMSPEYHFHVRPFD